MKRGGIIRMTESTKIHAQPFEKTGKDVGIFLIHDFGGSPAHLYPIATAFADAGYSVKLPRLLGHDTSPEELNQVNYTEILKSLELEFEPFFEEMEYIILLGFATGGALAQQLATKYEVEGLILINSLFQPPLKLMEEAETALKRDVDYVPRGTVDVKNERAEHALYAKYPTRRILELKEVSEKIQEQANLITTPVLVLQSIEDHVYPPSNADHLVNAFNSREKHLIMLYDSYHYAVIDYDQQRIFKQCLYFVKGLDPTRED